MCIRDSCWGIYVSGKVFHWVEEEGGLARMERRNWEKVAPLYDFLDGSELFSARVEPGSRSISNVCFRSSSPELDRLCVEEAARRGIVNIKGHRLTGGLRASCYNAVSPESVQALVSFLGDFESDHAAGRA